MSLKRVFRSPYAWTALSALLMLMSAPHVGWGAAFIWLILVPWFRALERVTSLRQALVQGIWLSFLFNVTIYAWGAYALREFAGVPWAVSVLILALASTVAQPQFVIFGPLYRWTGRQNGVVATAFLAFAYTGIDWFVPKLFLDTLGHGFTFMRNFRQVAELGGAHLLTFLAAFVNLTIAAWLRERRLRPVFPQVVASGALVLAFWSYGLVRAGQIEKSVAEAPLRIRAAAIQANVPNAQKLAGEMGVLEALQEIDRRFRGLSSQALSDARAPHLVIWPETALPMYFDSPRNPIESERERDFRRYVAELPVPLVTGTYERANESKDYNSMIFFPRDAEKRISYRKHVLLHFGDYIPGESLFPFVRKLAPSAVGRYHAGPGPAKVPLSLTVNGRDREVSFLPIICYEAIFPSYVRKGALLGPDVILNVTNDSWFGPVGEPQLHLALSAFRSIETRLPQVRVTNTGITALILPDGEITGATGVGEETWRNYEIPVMSAREPTLFVRWGDWFGGGSLLVAGVLGAALRLGGSGRRARIR